MTESENDQSAVMTVTIPFDVPAVTLDYAVDTLKSALLQAVDSGALLAFLEAQLQDIALVPPEAVDLLHLPTEDKLTAAQVYSFWVSAGPCLACRWQAAQHVPEMTVSCANTKSPFYNRWFDMQTGLLLRCAAFEAADNQQHIPLYAWNAAQHSFVLTAHYKQALG